MSRVLKVLMLTCVVGALCVSVALAASSPSVSTGGTSSSLVAADGTASVVLHGTVNPNGVRSYYQFSLGLTTSYGINTAFRPISGSKALTVTQTVGGLIPGTVYHYRVGAINRYGGGLGADRQFKTAGNPPAEVGTGPAQVMSSTAVTLTGVVNPKGEATAYYFQYGGTGFYGARTDPQTVPAGQSPVSVSVPVSGLAPGSTFHYRLVAVHGSITSYGLDATFQTFPTVRYAEQVRARTTPGRARNKPFVFTTSGQLDTPASLSKALACNQKLTVKFMYGRHQVALALVPVAADCTFSYQTVFLRLPARTTKRHRTLTLRVLIHARGNDYMAEAQGRTQLVTLG